MRPRKPKSIRQLEVGQAGRVDPRPIGDARVLHRLGLRDLIVRSDPRPPVDIVPAKRPVAPRSAAQLAVLAAGRERARQVCAAREAADREAGARLKARELDRLLLTMRPGEAYVLNDLIKPSGCNPNSVRAWLRQAFRRRGWVERVPASPGLPHKGPLKHGLRQKDPIRWLWRLTDEGVAERRMVKQG